MSIRDLDTVEWCDESVEEVEAKTQTKGLLLGLPCRFCGAYYESDLKQCPICGCLERVKANDPVPHSLNFKGRGLTGHG